MKAKLNSIFRALSGRLDAEHYCQMRNGKVVVCRRAKRRKGPSGGTVRNNRKFRRCALLASEMLKDDEVRAVMQRRMDEWNARFPKNWEAAESSVVRRKEEHPYVFLRQFVIAMLMRGK